MQIQIPESRAVGQVKTLIKCIQSPSGIHGIEIVHTHVIIDYEPLSHRKIRFVVCVNSHYLVHGDSHHILLTYPGNTKMGINCKNYCNNNCYCGKRSDYEFFYS